MAKTDMSPGIIKGDHVIIKSDPVIIESDMVINKSDLVINKTYRIYWMCTFQISPDPL